MERYAANFKCYKNQSANKGRYSLHRLEGNNNIGKENNKCKIYAMVLFVQNKGYALFLLTHTQNIQQSVHNDEGEVVKTQSESFL